MNTDPVDSPTKECKGIIDLYFTKLNGDHLDLDAVISKKEQKHDDSLLLRPSTPVSMVEPKQHKISSFFKVLDTTPSTANNGRALKRNMIYPVTASMDLGIDPKSKDYSVNLTLTRTLWI